MNIQQNLALVNHTVYSNRSIKYIVIHYFGALGSAKQTCAYFKSTNRQASAHYFVDDEIWQCVLDKDASWHCGDGGRGTFKGQCTNANSIGIEVRPYKVNTKSMSAGDKDWYFSDATIANLRELVRYLMDKHGIDENHIIRHYDVTAKVCPRPWVGDDINTYYGKTGNQLWKEFKASLEDDVKTTVITAKMNGVPTQLTSIIFNGENYIKIRDIANAQTDDTFTVDWNPTDGVIIKSK